jgi:hypothetical protein
MRVRLALVLALAVAALVLGLVLSESPTVVAGTNSVATQAIVAGTVSEAQACQARELIPANVSAVRLTLWSDAGPWVRVNVLSDGHVVTDGIVGGGWAGGSVTVPLRPLAHAIPGAQVCFRLGSTKEKVDIIGSRTIPAVAARTNEGETLSGRIRIEYLRSAHSSWLSMIPTVARRIGFGRAPSGVGVALLTAILMGAVAIATAYLVVRELS